jgi:hypothetical protein
MVHDHPRPTAKAVMGQEAPGELGRPIRIRARCRDAVPGAGDLQQQ